MTVRHVHVHVHDAGTSEGARKAAQTRKNKAGVLKEHGYTFSHRTRPGYSVYKKPGEKSHVAVTGTGKGAMWYHKTGEPAKNDWTASPNHSFGRTAEQLHTHLSHFHGTARHSTRENPVTG